MEGFLAKMDCKLEHPCSLSRTRGAQKIICKADTRSSWIMTERLRNFNILTTQNTLTSPKEWAKMSRNWGSHSWINHRWRDIMVHWHFWGLHSQGFISGCRNRGWMSRVILILQSLVDSLLWFKQILSCRKISRIDFSLRRTVRDQSTSSSWQMATSTSSIPVQA